MSDNQEQSRKDAFEGQVQSRKDVLKAAGLVAGGLVGGSLLGADRASAADGSPLTLGQANTATSKTSLTTSGSISNDGAVSVTAASADYGVYADAKNYGVVGSGPGGVLGLGTVGGVFSGSVVAINLDPLSGAGAPTGQSFKGDMAVDSNGVLYLCVAAGTPGTWIEVSHGGVRPLAVPQRAYDSRNSGGIFGNGESRDIAVAGVVSGVPANAVGAIGNVTITDTVGGGYVTIWPTGQTQPTTSNINWSGPNTTVANSFNLGVGTAGKLSVITYGTASTTTDVIVDITGYIL